MRRWLWRVVVAALAIGAGTGGGLWWRLWWALPVTGGRVEVVGIAQPVDILRDAHGIPHVRAGSEADAFFGLGFVHAQDRLWQMEFQRRVARGRLSEVLGPDALQADRWFRTLGFGRVAAETWARTGPNARAIVEAYVRGVNAVIARQQRTRRPVEFALLGIDPEPWTPEDCLVWAKVMSLGLDTNYRDELLRARLVGRIGRDGAAALLPAYTVGGPVILPDGPVQAPAAASTARAEGPAAVVTRLAAVSPLATTNWPFAPGFGGSNSWVVSGARSVTGKPLLANDPHLGGSLPSVWYVAHIEGGRVNVIGATLPGTPSVPIGHNERVAWGVTNLMADVEDIYVERINARNEAEFLGRWEPMRVSHETIRVKGQPSVELAVRATRHGPLISDVLPGLNEALALRWTALDADDELIDAQYGVALARDWNDFTLALARMRTPMLNFVYADVDGNIGYFAPGALPVRRHHDGTLPVPGWSGEFEWEGFVPVERLPRIYNPSRGFVATANNQALPDHAEPFIGTNWEPGYRAARIIDLIGQTPQLSVGAVATMQADVKTPQVRVLLPWMRRVRPVDETSRTALERLRTWDGTLSAGSPEAALFMAWLDTLTEHLFADELGPDLWREWEQWPQWRAKALDQLVVRGDDAWCDDVRSEAKETCEDLLGKALAEALPSLVARQGTSEPSAWRWGRDNEVAFGHTPFEAVRLLRPFFSRRVEMGGNSTTLNPLMRTPQRPTISSYRQIIDLANLDESRLVHAPGQSGQLLSQHYADLLHPWSVVEYVPMAFSRAAVDGAAVQRLQLEPR